MYLCLTLVLIVPVSVFLGSIIYAIVNHDDYCGIVEPILSVIVHTVISFSLGVLISMIICPIFNAVVHRSPRETEVVESSTYDLMMLSDNNAEDARYVLCTVKRNRTLQYDYMYITDKGFRAGSTLSDQFLNDTYIVESSADTPPQVTKRSKKFSSFWCNFFGFPHNEIIFEVPEGTISRNYEIDFQ